MPTTILHQTRWFSIRQSAAGAEYLASSGDEVLVVPLTSTGEVLLSIEPSAAFGGAHYYEYDLNDLAAGKTMLQTELTQWAADNHTQGVKALYDT